MHQIHNTRQTGFDYERLAGSYLEKQGYRILEYNFRCRYAEIDIIAEDGGCLIFCEVKYRKGTDMMRSLEAVSIRKQQRISRAALFYMSRKCFMEIPCRFDVIGITDTQIRHIKNAFYYTGG